MRLTVPFALRRPWLLTRELLQSRAKPDVRRLTRLDDPEAFVWRILPHAARTFAPSITLLPAEPARATAVAYLYCRILDTYEDLIVEARAREAALAEFGHRFGAAAGRPPSPAPSLDVSCARDLRDETHVVLVNRCHLLDEVFATLSRQTQRSIAELVRAMADGMIWSSKAFAEQGGVLIDEAQLSRYCRNVIGLPFLFAVQLLLERHAGDATVSDALREDCLAAGEMVQLANVTRDIEKDLQRGIAYHPALRRDLGRRDVEDPALQGRIRMVREQLLIRALGLAPAYERMMLALPFRTMSLERASGVLMLLFTDRYYRGCARRIGSPPWPGPSSTLALMLPSFHHLVSARASAKTVRRITDRLVHAAGRFTSSRRGDIAPEGSPGDAARVRR